MRFQHVEREVDATAVPVFLHVTEDVDELELDAHVDGVKPSASVFVTVNLDEDQADRRGDLEAVRTDVFPTPDFCRNRSSSMPSMIVSRSKRRTL